MPRKRNTYGLNQAGFINTLKKGRDVWSGIIVREDNTRSLYISNGIFCVVQSIPFFLESHTQYYIDNVLSFMGLSVTEIEEYPNIMASHFCKGRRVPTIREYPKGALDKIPVPLATHVPFENNWRFLEVNNPDSPWVRYKQKFMFMQLKNEKENLNRFVDAKTTKFFDIESNKWFIVPKEKVASRVVYSLVRHDETHQLYPMQDFLFYTMPLRPEIAIKAAEEKKSRTLEEYEILKKRVDRRLKGIV